MHHTIMINTAQISTRSMAHSVCIRKGTRFNSIYDARRLHLARTTCSSSGKDANHQSQSNYKPGTLLISSSYPNLDAQACSSNRVACNRKGRMTSNGSYVCPIIDNKPRLVHSLFLMLTPTLSWSDNASQNMLSVL